MTNKHTPATWVNEGSTQDGDFAIYDEKTDEEIIERLGKAYTYMNYQIGLGHTPTVMSIKEVIEDLEAERAMRIQRTMDEEYKKKFPDSDKPHDIGTVDKIDIEEFIRKAL